MSLYKDASLVMIPSAVKDGKLYSIRPTDGDGDFTFSRGSNLAATRVDVNGLIEKGRENVLLQSNQFDTTWLKASTSLTGNQSGYDGGNNAWLLEVTATGSYRRVYQGGINLDVNTFSIYAKANTSNFLFLLNNKSSTDAVAWFDLSNGTIGGVNGAIDTKIESVGSGWYRCSVTSIYADNQYFVSVADGIGSVTGTAGASLYIQDAQLESGLVATDVISTGASTAQAGILEDLPRLDYSGGASCPSLLLEPQRTNLIAYSEYFSSGYTLSSTAIISNNTTSPEGLQNATKLYPTASGNYRNIRYGSLSPSTGLHTFSIFAKAGELEHLVLIDYDGGGVGIDFDLSTGVATDSATIAFDFVDMVDYGNGWYRCIATATNPYFYWILSDNGGVSVTANGTDGLYIWGAQAEASASYPTSYIPTMGSAVTRSGDVADGVTIDTTANHTLLYDFNGTTGRETSSALFNIGYDNSNRYFIKGASSSSPQFQVSGTGIFSGSINPTNEVSGRNKIAVQWIDGTGYVYSNGVKQSGTLTNTSSANDIDYYKADGRGYSHEVNQLVIFNTALTDSECIALTTL